MSIEIHIKCPLCDTDGWATFGRLDGYMGVCGTSWGGGLTEPRQSPTCHIIQQLRIDNALLRMGVAA